MVLARGAVRVFMRSLSSTRLGNTLFLRSGSQQPAVPFCLSIHLRQQHSHNITSEKKEPKKDWLHRIFGSLMIPEDEKIFSAEEEKSRDELLARIQACYYKKPPEVPGVELYNETFDLLIKFDDERGVESLLELAHTEGVGIDDDMMDKIEDFLISAKEKKTIW